MYEIAKSPSNVFDLFLNKNVGNITGLGTPKISLFNHKGTRTNMIVLMFEGMLTKWKQTVAYYFMETSVNGRVYTRS
jgi:hypothetical protein